jgi:hypothetical protein
MFGYKPDGSAKLFDLRAGEILPNGWSDDINVIENADLRTGEAVTASAGGSLVHPVRVGAPEPHEAMTYADFKALSEDGEPLLYDENNVQVKAKRGPGRPRKDSYADD